MSAEVRNGTRKDVTMKIAFRISGAILRMLLNIILYAVVIVVVYRVSVGGYNLAYQMFGSVPKDEAPGITAEFQVLKGETVYSISSKLYNSKLIVNKYSFFLKTRLKEYNIKPGTYVLNSAMDYNEILSIITDENQSIAAGVYGSE